MLQCGVVLAHDIWKRVSLSYEVGCVLQVVAVCCSVLLCVAVCCSVLRCVAVCCSVGSRHLKRNFGGL